MKKRSKTQKVMTQKPTSELARQRAAFKRYRELRRELNRLRAVKRGKQFIDSDERKRLVREKEHEYSEAFAELQRIHAEESTTDVESDGRPC